MLVQVEGDRSLAPGLRLDDQVSAHLAGMGCQQDLAIVCLDYSHRLTADRYLGRLALQQAGTAHAQQDPLASRAAIQSLR
jgi:hypothetical protein